MPSTWYQHTIHNQPDNQHINTTTMRTLFTVALLALMATAALCACPEDCTAFKMEEPPKPEDPGVNTGEMVGAILEGFLTTVRAKTFGGLLNDFGYIVRPGCVYHA